MSDLSIPTPGSTVPATPKKKGCGCCLGGCLTSLFIFFLLTVGTGVFFWYGMKNLTIPDPAVLWIYENAVRPQIEKSLPPNLNPNQKRQILKTADFGVRRYLQLTPARKKAILKEAVIASYYYSNQQIIPPEKIPNLNAFIQETVEAYQQGP